MAYIFAQVSYAEQQFQQLGSLVGVPIHIFLGQYFDCEIHLSEQPVHGGVIHVPSTLKFLCGRCEPMKCRF